MKILVDQTGHIIFTGEKILFGVFENEQKWAIMDASNKVRVYALDNSYTVVDYNGELPADMTSDKYIYSNGELVINPEWTPSEEETLAEQVANLEATLDDLLTNIIPMLME